MSAPNSIICKVHSLAFSIMYKVSMHRQQKCVSHSVFIDQHEQIASSSKTVNRRFVTIDQREQGCL